MSKYRVTVLKVVSAQLSVTAAAAQCGISRRRALAIVDEREATVVDLGTGEILSTHFIEPAKGYRRNQRRDPGRWPGSQETS